MKQKLHIMTLGVEDLRRSLDFYETGLGWKRSPKSTGDLVVFPLGGIAMALYPKKELAEDTTLEYQPSVFPGMTVSYNAKSEQEVDRILEKVQQLGAVIVKPAQKVFWGGYGGYFKDPDGYVFEVAYNPFWDFDSNDNLIL